MSLEQAVIVSLDDGSRFAVVAEQVGPVMVGDTEIVARLAPVTAAVERVSHDVLAAIRKAGPSEATVELGFGVAIEAGQLIALFGKGTANAAIKVTLKWVRPPGEAGEVGHVAAD